MRRRLETNRCHQLQFRKNRLKKQLQSWTLICLKKMRRRLETNRCHQLQFRKNRLKKQPRKLKPVCLRKVRRKVTNRYRQLQLRKNRQKKQLLKLTLICLKKKRWLVMKRCLAMSLQPLLMKKLMTLMHQTRNTWMNQPNPNRTKLKMSQNQQIKFLLSEMVLAAVITKRWNNKLQPNSLGLLKESKRRPTISRKKNF